ncbi:hypothetical protein [uncultured Aquimarina sp.]|uniref:hypothetical protein n=1 Tax=uncultured Aquimarina sp. TaxID=575652 RepID=UPI002626BBAC|nr:hypothetical protein [uncultured Aquimarina sp.]
MKKIILGLLLFSTISSFSQSLPEGLDGKINYKKGNYVQFAKSVNSITRSSNKVSIKLDSIVYFVPKKKDYFVNFRIDLFEEKGEKPTRSYSYLIEDIVENRVDNKQKKQILTNQTLASGVNLKNIKFLQLKCEIIEKQDNEDAINSTLDKFLNQMVEGVPYVNLVNQLLSAQNEDEEILFFNKDYDIPLNNVEYTFKQSTDDNNRLLSSKIPIYIPINAAVQNEFINPSVAGYLFKKISQLTELVSGVQDIDGKTYDIDGMIKLRITNDDNINIPDYLINTLQDLVLSLNFTQTGLSDFENLKKRLTENLKTYKSSNLYDEKINFSIQSVLQLSEIYKILLTKEAIFKSNAQGQNGEAVAVIEFELFRRKFKDYYERLSFQEKDFGFIAYGIQNSIYSGKYARIFIPYSLPDIANNEMIRWQINVHEILSEMHNGKYAMPFEP